MSKRFAATLRCVASLCCALAGWAQAHDTGTDPSMVVEKFVQSFVVNDDGSFSVTIDSVKTIALARAVQTHGQYYISYNTTLEQVDGIEAHTLKPDGRRIAVLPEQIKDQQELASAEAPMFQDTRVKIVVFPDVAVGDQLAVHYVVKRATALFPGQFEDLTSSHFFQTRQFELIYDLPEGMPLYADAAGFVALPIDAAPGRKRYRWQYVGGENARIELDSVSYLDYGKRLAVSTFADYPAFARAYAARANPMAQPGAAVSALARQLTAPLGTPRAKALALSEWVRRHIRYVGVYIGPGGVVPHAAETVLENRYGDCKDHVALLEALLTAAGIDSSAALINAGNAYRLPRIPTLGIFNHVITYIPSLDLYLDSTAESVAAGYLPNSDLGKPVLLINSGTLARTPYAQSDKNRNIALFGVKRSGASSFSVAKQTSGAIAEPYRQAVRDTKPADRELFVQRMLQSFGQKGSGVFDPGRLDSSDDDYVMLFAGSSENFVNLPGPTGVGTVFNFWGGLADTVYALVQERERSQDFMCPALDHEDVTGLEFPPGVRILALPKPLVLRDPNLRYSSSYRRKGNSVTVQRSVRFRHEGMVCTPAEYKRFAPLIDRIIRDLKSQVVVKAG